MYLYYSSGTYVVVAVVLGLLLCQYDEIIIYDIVYYTF